MGEKKKYTCITVHGFLAILPNADKRKGLKIDSAFFFVLLYTSVFLHMPYSYLLLLFIIIYCCMLVYWQLWNGTDASDISMNGWLGATDTPYCRQMMPIPNQSNADENLPKWLLDSLVIRPKNMRNVRAHHDSIFHCCCRF